MDFTFSPSPSADLVVDRYDPESFPKFRIVFETHSPDGPLRLVVQPAEEAERAIVLENRSERDITALRYRWIRNRDDGKVIKGTVSSDSYTVDIYHPVLKPHDRKLICLSSTVDESFVEHIRRGGGGTGSGGRTQSLTGVTSLRLEFDMVLFADGEIAGPDTGGFAAELRCRKPAAEFVAKQIRLAEAEGRDIRPVLSALAEAPYLHPDPLAEWTQRYANECLRRIENPFPGVDWRSTMLRRLESRPALPKFYRRNAEPMG